MKMPSSPFQMCLACVKVTKINQPLRKRILKQLSPLCLSALGVTADSLERMQGKDPS